VRFDNASNTVVVYWGENLVFLTREQFALGLYLLLLTITLSLYLAVPRDKIADENAVTVEQIY